MKGIGHIWYPLGLCTLGCENSSTTLPNLGITGTFNQPNHPGGKGAELRGGRKFLW